MPRCSPIQLEFIRVLNILQNCVSGYYLQGFEPQESPNVICDLPNLNTQFYGKNITVNFNLSPVLYGVNGKAKFLQQPIPIHQVRMARRIVSHFPKLLPEILKSLKDLDSDFADEAMIRDHVYDPRISFDPSDPPRRWSFALDRHDLGFYYIVEFQDLEITDYYSGG